MGYTHYWHRKQAEIPLDLWQLAVKKIAAVVEAGSSRAEVVVMSDEALMLDGTCESFYLQRCYKHRPHETREFREAFGMRSFCKTSHGAYDPIVVACLVIFAGILKGHEVGFTWSSDGTWPGAHVAGLELAGISIADAAKPQEVE
jgi:hypothetical protein